jgi:phosphoribosylformylglycinamidine cyclo-ligase
MLAEGLEVVLQRHAWPRPAVFEWLAATGGIEQAEMYRTFNCGIGMVVIVAAAKAEQALAQLAESGEHAMLIGEVRRGERGVVIET